MHQIYLYCIVSIYSLRKMNGTENLKFNVCSSFVTKMQDKITTRRQIIQPYTILPRSNNSVRHQQTEITLKEKLREDVSRGMPNACYH
jgi:hypothetical protein